MITLFSPAKLTVDLRIVGRRDDGYHLIDAEMVSLDFGDTIEIGPGEGVEVEAPDTGLAVSLGDDNLVSAALRLVDRAAAVKLTKRIPAGAGLGGGSSNAAAILRWAGFDDLVTAVALGADIAFCLVGGRARVTGIGEIVEPLPFEERSYTLLTPPFGCSTPEVYRAFDRLGPPTGEHGNDLEQAALDVAPDLARFRDELGEVAGIRPRLAGSGSTWFVPGEFPGGARVVARTIPAHPSNTDE